MLYILIYLIVLSFYSCICFPVLLFLLPCLYLDFPQIVQVYIMFVFLFVFAFLLFLDIAGFEPHFPKLPIPLPRPLNFALVIEPLVRVPLLKPVLTSFIFWGVFFLHLGQNLFVVFGNFILR